MIIPFPPKKLTSGLKEVLSSLNTTCQRFLANSWKNATTSYNDRIVLQYMYNELLDAVGEGKDITVKTKGHPCFFNIAIILIIFHQVGEEKSTVSLPLPLSCFSLEKHLEENPVNHSTAIWSA